MRKLKSIDEIYGEVKGCAFVLTNDASLATALNKLVDRPMIGHFAMTSRQLASMCASNVMKSSVWGELKVITAICEENPDLDLRYVHGEVQRIREIRQYTKDVEKHLFTKSSKKVYQSWKSIPTVEGVMDRFDPGKMFYPDIRGRIAVVGVDMFNDLDKCMVPPGSDWVDVDIFTDEECFIPEIYQIGNDRQLAENAVALIDGKDPNDFAIVLNVSSPLADSVRTALYRKNIPFINNLKVRDLNPIRDFIQFVQLALSFETLRVKHVREIFSSLNADVSSGDDEHLLSKVALKGKALELREVMKTIRNHTFDDVRKSIYGPNVSAAVKIVIEDLEISNKKVCTRLAERMIYSVDNISDLRHNERIPESEKMGVLLADSQNSVFIDRPIVIYLGMSDDWDLDIAGRKYIDNKDEEMWRAAVRLEALLQQGAGRFYLVNTSRNGKPAKPSSLFSRLFQADRDKDSLEFNDLLPYEHDIRKERWCDSTDGNKREPDDRLVDPKPYGKPFSQSGFKTYYGCPYSFQFHSTLNSKDADYFEFGNLIHSFAELYFSHPELVKGRFEELVGLASERFSGISSPALGEIDAGRIRCGMTNVMRYIDSLEFAGDRKMVPVPDKHDNFFYDVLGITETSSLCESDIHSEKHPIHGKMDLNVGTVVDYKTKKEPMTASEICKKLVLDGRNADIDCQALFYLAIANEKWSGEEMQFLFVMGNDTEYTQDGYDVLQNVRKVIIYDSADSPIDIDVCICDHFAMKNKSKCGSNPEKLMAIIQSSAIGGSSTWSEDESVILAVMKEFGYNGTNGKTTVINAIKMFAEIYDSGIYASDDAVIIRKEKLDEIMSRIGDLHAKMMTESVSEFSKEHIVKCEKCDYFKVCTHIELSADVGEADSHE